ncbi:hypothetical protein M3Y94_00875300 [Aphelenchoides besseyi]|nr:hypothetical protein M3Y94_00875300 [Aphelenchoides besseyi]KAI6226613.1 RNA polymerase-associated protein LEO1 [Aphelenchoides besseyi]
MSDSSDSSSSNSPAGAVPQLSDNSDSDVEQEQQAKSDASSSNSSTPAANAGIQGHSDVDKSSSDSDSDAEQEQQSKSSDGSSSNSSTPAANAVIQGQSDADKTSSDSDSDADDRPRQSAAGDKKSGKTKADMIFQNQASDSDSDVQMKGQSDDEDAKMDDDGERQRMEAMQQMLNDSDEEVGQEPLVIEEQMPASRIELGDMGPVFVRLPNFLSIEPQPFDERTYHPEVDEDEMKDEEGRSRMKLKIENTIRWRSVKDPETGEIKPQSNAKIVKWSDGTMSLYLGSEIFEIQDQQNMSNVQLCTRMGTTLFAQATFRRKFTFRPHSTDTLTHRKMTMGMADKTNRAQKVKMVTDVGMNPEKDRLEKIKKEEEKIRAAARKQASQRRTRERNREMGISSGFLEGDDSDEGESLGAIKRQYSAGGSGVLPPYYSDDSDEDERSRRQLRDAKFIESDDEDSNGGPSTSTHKETQKPKRRIIEDDDED